MKALLSIAITSIVGVTWLVPTPAGADTILENFESYPDGRIVGPNATSSPWRRFGSATNDHITATRQDRWVITGDVSGLYGLVWPNTFGAVRYVFDKATSLSSYTRVTVKMRSDKIDTHTRVRLAISSGRTTYVAIGERPLTLRPGLLTFELGRTSLIRTAGDETYDDVIQQVWNIGFDFHNSEGEHVETIIFDDFLLTGSASNQN